MPSHETPEQFSDTLRDFLSTTQVSYCSLFQKIIDFICHHSLLILMCFLISRLLIEFCSKISLFELLGSVLFLSASMLRTLRSISVSNDKVASVKIMSQFAGSSN
jgi:hypothetical protein